MNASLDTAYSSLGVTFSGPSAGSGGAILNDTGGWSVAGHSSPNFVAFNTSTTLLGGGIPTGPETIQFTTPTTSATTMTVIGDLLVVLMMKRIGFTPVDYALRHHGGYLGQKSRET